MGRLTKIIATVGPACSDEGSIEALIAAGVDVFRLNFSHGSYDEHGAVIARIRAAGVRAGRHVAILQDLSGPKIRTGKLVDGKPLDLVPGESLEIATGDFVGGPGRVSTTFAGLAASVKPGDRLLLDDGHIELVTHHEPLAGIDPINVADIRSLVAHLKDRGLGVLITDHNVRDTLDIIDRAYILHEGQVLMEGAPAEIVAHEGVRRVYLGDRFSL